MPLFCHRLKQLNAADTIPKVFLILNDYFSFFNYHIIEHIIEELGTEEDKAELQQYKEDFDQYATRGILKVTINRFETCVMHTINMQSEGSLNAHPSLDQ